MRYANLFFKKIFKREKAYLIFTLMNWQVRLRSSGIGQHLNW
jgi:hypothetical protein